MDAPNTYKACLAKNSLYIKLEVLAKVDLIYRRSKMLIQLYAINNIGPW